MSEESSLFRIKYWARDGTQIPLLVWAGLFEDDEYCVVGHDHVGPYVVSTCWMGHDLRLNIFGGARPPLIFETMVFGPERDSLDCRQYATEAQAREGHDSFVTLMRATVQSAEDILEQDSPARKDDQ